jgi:DNA polymerase-3 subunit epsilon
MGGRQIGLGLMAESVAASTAPVVARAPRIARPPRIFVVSEGDLERHAAFMRGIKDPIWGAAASG